MDTNKPRVILITGASSGIGRDTAAYFHHIDEIVCGASRTVPDHIEYDYYQMDVSDRQSVFQTVTHIIAKYGRIDVLIHCAGFSIIGPYETFPIEKSRNQMEVNFWGTVHVTQAVLPHMRRQKTGRIIMIGSIAGLIGLPFQSFYSTSKFGLEALNETIRIETRKSGIQTCIINPGDINTEIVKNHQYAPPPEDSDYSAVYPRMVQHLESNVRNGSPVGKVTRAIIRATNARKMKHRYVVGSFLEKFAYWGKRVLPPALFEMLYSRFFGL